MPSTRVYIEIMRTKQLPEVRILNIMERLIKKGWTRGAMYRTATGAKTPNQRKAAKCCLAGARAIAVARVPGSTKYDRHQGTFFATNPRARAWNALKTVCNREPVFFNDAQRTKGPVIKKIREARELILKQQEAKS